MASCLTFAVVLGFKSFNRPLPIGPFLAPCLCIERKSLRRRSDESRALKLNAALVTGANYTLHPLHFVKLYLTGAVRFAG